MIQRLMTFVLFAGAASVASAQTPPPAMKDPLADKVLVVYNTRYPESVDVADYYISQRQIPASNRCPIDAPSGDGWYAFGSAAAYKQAVKTPIQNCLNAVGADKILYIVFTYLTPDKVFDDAAYPMYAARAIDSLVADVWSVNDSSLTINPYSTSEQSADNVYIPFVSLEQFRAANPADRIYSVWRLDARTAAQAKALIDKAMTVEAYGITGRGCFDRRYADPLGTDTSYEAGDWDIQRAADFVQSAGFPVTLDTNPAEFNADNRCDGAAFYGGWYSYDFYNDAFTWTTGAMGWHLDSLSLWSPRDSTSWGGGAIERGITVTTGAVSEPYLGLIPHLDSFFKDVLEGANVGDAMLRHTEALNWMIVNVGDPLYRPFRAAVPAPAPAPPPPPPPPPPQTVPAVSIATPYTSSSYPTASNISFSGNASDTTDGNISATLVWTSSLQGQLGTGASFSKALSAGTHTITAKATDTAGLTGSAQVTVTVGSSQSPGPSLSARAYKVKGAQRVDLTWSGFASGSVDVYRNGRKVITTPNDGAQTDAINAKGGGSYSYKACEAGSTSCSPAVSVTF